jgi:phage terminase large subunit GpA-like protein
MLPPRDITVSQWADENRVLTGGAAAERGQWRTRPYQREPMDVLSPSHPCRQVVVLSGAQILKTEVLLNFIGFIADVDPGPVLVVEPRTEDAKALSKDRVAPMFRARPHCVGRSRPSSRAIRATRRCTRSSQTAQGTSRSPERSRPRAWPCGRSAMRCSMRWTVTRRARARRATRFRWRSSAPRSSQHNKKIVMASTPTIKGVSRIELAWRESDQRDYFVPCPSAVTSRCSRSAMARGRAGVAGGDLPEDAMYRCAGAAS